MDKLLPHHDHRTSKPVADGSDSGAGSISISSQGSGRMSSLRDLTRSPTPHSISGISLSSSGPEVPKSARLARSPVSLKSFPSKLHDVSDGIRPPTTKAYEKNISSCKDHLAEENKDDYTRWVNHFHSGLITEDIVPELADGVKLLALVSRLSGQNLLPEKGSSLHHQTLNVEKVFDCLQQLNIDVSNLSASDVTRGRREAVLAVVWTLILNFSNGQIQDFDGLRAFLAEAEMNRRRSDSLPRRAEAIRVIPEEVKDLSYSTSDEKAYQTSSSLFHPKPIGGRRENGYNPMAEQPVSYDHVDSAASSSMRMEYITPAENHLNTQRQHQRPASHLPLKPTPLLLVSEPTEPTARMAHTAAGRSVRQRMYEVKEKSRAALLKNQSLDHLLSPLRPQEPSGKPKQLEDQNRNLHFVHPVQELVLESSERENDPKQAATTKPSLLSSLRNQSPAWKALKVVLPLQALLLLMVGMSFMVPNLEEISCFDCLKENNYIREFGPVFYHSFTPPI